MIIKVSELRLAVEYLEANNVDLACVSLFPSSTLLGDYQLNIESIDINNGAGVNIESGIPF